ncbi:ATP-binding protein [Amycolatopsis coloradensis]|uniref:ATP-binding protein n=1 Tax=Amycolatopsis coloradensis TaxID=76021 RepID=A0ACD5B9G9_9PSEU
MSESRFIDVTPHPRILGVLGDIEFANWQCLAELIDNAFDEFLSANDTTKKPTVAVSLPPANADRSTASISVRDNGRGMSLEAVTKAISAGWTSNARHGALGLFGMGFNISTARLGRHTTVVTSREGDTHWVEVVLNLAEIANTERYQAPFRLVPKANPAEHGTTVTVSELKSEQFQALRRTNTQKAIRENLGDIYSYLLETKGFTLTLNNKKVFPRRQCVWDESRFVTRNGVDIHAVQRIDRELSARLACMDCGNWNPLDVELCEECGSERLSKRARRVHGWIGIQRYVHKSEYGIDFLRNGRKILIRDKRAFYWLPEDAVDPELEYPIDDKSARGRIVGEIHCDHVTPNYQKNAFEFESLEWQQVLRLIRGDTPLRPKRLPGTVNDSPLALLYTGYRRNSPAGLSYLIPGKDGQPIHEKTYEWAKRFRDNDPDYETDEIWYRSAYQNDHPPTEPDTGDDASGTGILPGLDDDEQGDDDGTGPHGQPGDKGESNPPAETVEDRLKRYREHGEPLLDLNGKYNLADLGSIELSAWLVKGQKLIDRREQPAPVVTYMLRSPTLEVFVNLDDPLFQRRGADPRDIALVEVSEYLRVRASRLDTPLSRVIAHLKDSNAVDDLTPTAMADMAERLLDQVREAMIPFVAESPQRHWHVTTEMERKDAQRRFAFEVPGAEPWGDQIETGEFIRYLRGNAVKRILREAPETFFDNRVFARAYEGVDESVRDVVVERVLGPLGDLALLEEQRPRLELDELARVRASARLVSRALAR